VHHSGSEKTLPGTGFLGDRRLTSANRTNFPNPVVIIRLFEVGIAIELVFAQSEIMVYGNASV
jgi:hypothetical protein